MRQSLASSRQQQQQAGIFSLYAVGTCMPKRDVIPISYARSLTSAPICRPIVDIRPSSAVSPLRLSIQSPPDPFPDVAPAAVAAGGAAHQPALCGAFSAHRGHQAVAGSPLLFVPQALERAILRQYLLPPYTIVITTVGNAAGRSDRLWG